jgi:uridine phosphorylase
MRPILLFCAAVLLAACGPAAETSPARRSVLDAYARFNHTPRVIDPAGYIGFLKSTRFKGGELDSLPRCAILLHDARPLTYVARVGVDTTRVQRLVLGSSDPSVLNVVRRAAPAASFIIAAGLPGAGGITIQTAELAALGTHAIVHVGTAGLIGDAIPDSAAVLSRGSYKDGGAVMLSSAERADSLVSRPDSLLTSAVRASLRATGVTVAEQTGFTSPIIYFQPSGLIKWLIGGEELAGERPAYVEMEQAPFFETGRHMQVRTASVVVGSDRYRLANDSLSHSFVDIAADAAKQRVITAVLDAFASFPECRR